LATGVKDALDCREAPVAPIGDIELAHDRMMVAGLRGLSARLQDDINAGGPAYIQIDPDTTMNVHTWDAAMRAAGVVGAKLNSARESFKEGKATAKKVASVEAEWAKLQSTPIGTKLSDLDPLAGAWLVRSHNELFGDTKVYDHNLEFVPEFMTEVWNSSTEGWDEVPGGKLRWQQYGTIAGALRILRDPAPATISAEVGGAHKVRNFYNNHVDPSNQTDVTVDTHAVGVSILDVVSSNHYAVKDALGGSKHTKSGYTGTYPIYADAYREAARRLGVMTREVQSVTWEGIRAQLNPKVKSKSKKWLPGLVNNIHTAVELGRLDPGEGRALIWAAFGHATASDGKPDGLPPELTVFLPDIQ
jgi:hypothetical protein